MTKIRKFLALLSDIYQTLFISLIGKDKKFSYIYKVETILIWIFSLSIFFISSCSQDPNKITIKGSIANPVSDELVFNFSDTSYEKDDKQKWLEINEKYSKLWPNISVKKDPPKDADKFKNVKNKLDKYFSEKPGE